MSATASPSGVPSLKWIVAVGLCALALVMIGAVIVEPAMHRLMLRWDRAEAPTRPAPERIEVGEAVLSGRYVAGPGLALTAEGGVLTTDGGGRLTSAPHRLVMADEPASVSRAFADLMAVPPGVQIEIRRVMSDQDSRLCAGHEVGWLAFAMRRDGFRLMPVRQGPPPGALAPDDRLCGVLDFGR